MIPSDLWKSPEIWAVIGYGGYALAINADPVFCPEGPTSATALVVAKGLTGLTIAGWAYYVGNAALAANKAAAAEPQ